MGYLHLLCIIQSKLAKSTFPIHRCIMNCQIFIYPTITLSLNHLYKVQSKNAESDMYHIKAHFGTFSIKTGLYSLPLRKVNITYMVT